MPHSPRFIQSPYVVADFWANWDSVNPRIALFVKVTSKADFGSATLGFTTNSRDMTLPGHAGVTFRPSSALTPTVIEQGLDEPSNLEMTGAYEQTGFSQPDVIAGKWAFASIEVFSACWDDQTATGGIDKRRYGELLHFKGNLGEFKDYQTYFTAEGRGLISRLSNDVNAVTSRLCRAPEYGDPVFCKKDLTGNVTIGATAYKITQTGIQAVSVPLGTAIAIDIFTLGMTGNIPPANFYKNGKMTGTTGNNAGISREIASSSAASSGIISLGLKRPFPFVLTATGGEIFTLVQGCDHTIEDCIQNDNIVNRRAEDYIPGIESITRLPTVS